MLLFHAQQMLPAQVARHFKCTGVIRLKVVGKCATSSCWAQCCAEVLGVDSAFQRLDLRFGTRFALQDIARISMTH